MTEKSGAPQVITAGVYHLNIDCPECKLTVMFPIELRGRLTVDPDGARLAAKMSSKTTDHKCGVPDNVEPMF
jgi:hypothetical protein